MNQSLHYLLGVGQTFSLNALVDKFERICLELGCFIQVDKMLLVQYH
jgi:hypothetical protein